MTSPVDDLELVRVFFEDVAPIDPAARHRAAARLRPRLVTSPRVGQRVAVAALLVAAVLTAGLFFMGPQRSATASRTLERMALLATTADLAAGSAPITYERVEELSLESRTGLGDLDGFSYVVRSESETWRTEAGGLHRTEIVNVVEFLTDEDRATWSRMGQPVIARPGDIRTEDVPPGQILLPSLDGLPTDPAALLDIIQEQLAPGADTPEELFYSVSELLARGDASPGLRATLFRAAEGIDGIEAVGEVTDPLGREGVGLSLGPPERQVTMVVDPKTSKLLATERTMLLRGNMASTWIAYLDWATVYEVGEQPRHRSVV